MEGRNAAVVDVRSFWFFESTGDSEGDFDVNMDPFSEDMDAGGDDEDDAQSCSYDMSHTSARAADDRFCDFDRRDDSFDDDDDEDMVDQAWSSGYKVMVPNIVSGFILMMAGIDKKSTAYFGSGMEVMSERDKDRLFWETCLAT